MSFQLDSTIRLAWLVLSELPGQDYFFWRMLFAPESSTQLYGV